MEDDLGRLSDALKKLQRIIYALNTELREVFELKATLQELDDAYKYLSSVLSVSPELEKPVAQFVRENDLLVTFKEMRARYDALSTVLRRYDALISEIEEHLERYRNYRYYMFKEDEDAVRFLDILLSRAGNVVVRPLIVDSVDVGKIAKNLSIKQRGKFSFEVPGEKLAEVLMYIMKRYPKAGFVVQANTLKATWKPDIGTLRVETEKERILECDRIAQRLDATVLDI